MVKTYLQLGRCGDVLTLLPLLYSDAQKGDKPRLIVSKDYANLLDGTSYIEPVVHDGHYHEMDKALKLVNGDPVISTQINGVPDIVKKITYKDAKPVLMSSFVKEQWRMSGRVKEWDDCLPLVFDKRDATREKELIQGLAINAKVKLILVSLAGNSSPFPYKPLLMELLKLRFKLGYQIIDLSSVKADRFFDLLALYDKAYCLVASDSAPLHLSWACPNLPVLALTNDKPSLWNGSPWRPNHWWYCRYSDFPHRAPEMLEAIAQIKNRPKLVDGPKIVHVWNAYQKTVRFNFSNPSWIPTPIQPGSCGRDSVNMFNDTVRVPMFKDAVKMGLQKARNEDTVVVTRPDTCFNEGTFPLDKPCYAYRLENGTYHPTVDMFCAPKPAWKSMLDTIPDLVFGNDFFLSEVMRGIFQQHHAVDVTGVCHREIEE